MKLFQKLTINAKLASTSNLSAEERSGLCFLYATSWLTVFAYIFIFIFLASEISMQASILGGLCLLYNTIAIYLIQHEPTLKKGLLNFNLNYLLFVAFVVTQNELLPLSPLYWLLFLPIVNCLACCPKLGWLAAFIVSTFIAILQLTFPNYGFEDTAHYLELYSMIFLSTLVCHIYCRNRNLVRSEWQRSEKLLSATNSLAKIGGWSFNPETNNLWWSDQTYTIHEIPIGAPLDINNAINYYAPEVRSEVEVAVNACIEEGTPWDYHWPLVTANGNRIWVHAKGNRTIEPNGNMRLSGTFQDITEQHLTEQALREAHDAALFASKAKSRFLSSMNHELRTPMHGIMANADLLVDHKLEPESAALASDIYASCRILVSIINDILDYSALTSEQQELTPKPMQPVHMVNSLEAYFRWLAKEKNIQLLINTCPEAKLWVLGDEQRIRKILFNLISNAIKFTDRGSITLTISYIPNTKQLRFEVSDTGSGIKSSQLEFLFSRFQQLDDGVNRKYQGTGLGLSMSQELIELMESEIHVVTEPGEGSAFSFVLELPFVAPPKHSRADGKKLSPDSAPILIVDDNDINLKLAVNHVKKLGFQTAQATGGAEAIKMALDNDYLLILMDINMPEVDGIDATVAILKEKPNQIVIALTASVMQDNLKAYYKAGILEAISKPFTAEDLIHTLSQYTTIP